MNARTGLMICIVLLASLFVFGSRANVQKSGTTWEYKVLRNSFDEKQMNGLGAEGWELVTIGVDGNVGSGWAWAFFKRPK